MKWTSELARRLVHASATLHRIIGAPDYDGYVQHLNCCHPDATPMPKDEFVRQRLEERYARPGARCC